MKSIRAWLFGMFPLIAIATLIAMDVRTAAVSTHDWRDLCVRGRGYIATVDDNGQNTIWLRSIQLCINQDGELCAYVDGRPRRITPYISVPSDWTRIDIDEKGNVRVTIAENSGTQIGTVALTTFSGDDVNESLRIENQEHRMGQPMWVTPGVQGAGELMQRAALQYCIPLTLRTSIAFAFFALWIAGGVVYSASCRKQKEL